MGICISSSYSHDQEPPNCANVVSVTGVLHQYSLPITVSQVVESESRETTSTTTSTSSSSSSSAALFICNSDCLYFDDYIPALDPQDQLQPAHIYFVLSLSKLHYKLTASDMAALAVKASVALQTHNNNIPHRRSKNHKARISPVLLEEELKHPPQAQTNLININNKQQQEQAPTTGLGISRSGSIRKLQRFSSRRAKMGVRSFRIKLTTIYEEGSVLLFN